MKSCKFTITNKNRAVVVSEMDAPSLTNQIKDYKCHIGKDSSQTPALITGMVSVGAFVISMILCCIGMSECLEHKADEVRAANAPPAPATTEAATTTTETTTETPGEPTVTSQTTPDGSVEMQFNPAGTAPPSYTDPAAAPSTSYTAGPSSSYATAFGSDPLETPATSAPAYPVDGEAPPAGSYSVDPSADDAPAPESDSV